MSLKTKLIHPTDVLILMDINREGGGGGGGGGGPKSHFLLATMFFKSDFCADSEMSAILQQSLYLAGILP